MFIENDVEVDDLRLINDNISIILVLPELCFANDSGISKVTTWQGTPHATEVENKFLRCSKNYLSSFFDKRVAQCVGNARKNVEGLYDFVIRFFAAAFCLTSSLISYLIYCVETG